MLISNNTYKVNLVPVGKGTSRSSLVSHLKLRVYSEVIEFTSSSVHWLGTHIAKDGTLAFRLSWSFSWNWWNDDIPKATVDNKSIMPLGNKRIPLIAYPRFSLTVHFMSAIDIQSTLDNLKLKAPEKNFKLPTVQNNRSLLTKRGEVTIQMNKSLVKIRDLLFQTFV